MICAQAGRCLKRPLRLGPGVLEVAMLFSATMRRNKLRVTNSSYLTPRRADGLVCPIESVDSFTYVCTLLNHTTHANGPTARQGRCIFEFELLALMTTAV